MGRKTVTLEDLMQDVCTETSECHVKILLDLGEKMVPLTHRVIEHNGEEVIVLEIKEAP